ncbi:hypothetical protein ACE2AJ_07945 [Aquihabitans daechungensis]|uniref:hypothetical protein n=1 Tax=Aquihabitans daechungensis TaxID=1052257 RepID=UPI003B9E7CE3
MAVNASGGSAPGDWRRKRNLRLGIGAAGLAVVLLAITFWPRSGGVDDVATAPSTESTTTLDTSPFELLQPRGGPTTIPDGVLETTSTTRIEPTTTQGSTTTTEPPTTTTTRPPTTTTLPIPGKQQDPACQAVVELITLVRRISRTTTLTSAQRVGTTQLRAIASLLEDASPTRYRGAILVARDRTEKLERATTREEIAAIIGGMVDNPPPEIASAFDPVVEHVLSECPDVLAAR